MKENKHILIKNIYYMLAYAFKVLRQSNFDEIEAESFDKVHDLFATILAKGLSVQMKRGLYREYIEKSEDLTALRGKVDTYRSFKNKTRKSNKLSCEFDEFSTNNEFNRILKTTALMLYREKSVSRQNKLGLKRVLLFLSEIDEIELRNINWNGLIYHKNNENYEMLIGICYYIINGLILTKEKGKYLMANFLDDQELHQLFESFVFQYYKKHTSLRVSAPNIAWDVEGDIVNTLPAMKTDIVLSDGDKRLIIDTKFYSKTWQKNTLYNKHTLRSNHLYQIYSYVKNEDRDQTGNVSGMLLYAKTDEDIAPNEDIIISGNKISIRTLDLNQDFKIISRQLNEIVEESSLKGTIYNYG